MQRVENSGQISVGRDFVVEQSIQSQSNLLVNCDTPTLFAEREFRAENLAIERTSKRKFLLKRVGYCIFALLLFSGYLVFLGKPDFAQAACGFGSLGLAYLALVADRTPSEFELQERAAINEIYLILKARRAVG
jgi:hypothetical protein